MKKSTLLLRFTLFALMLLSAKGLSAYDFYTGGIYYGISSSGVTVENKGSFNTYSGNVTIPEKVTYGGTTYNVIGIGYQAFKNCTGLTGVTIPKTVYMMLNESFYGCTSLTTIVLPSSITAIYNNVFVGCTGLKSIYVMRKTPASTNTNNFSSSTYSSATLYVPEEAYDAYKSTAPWSSFTTIKKTNYDFEKNGIYYKITDTSAKTVKVTYRDTDYDNYSGSVNIPSSVTYDGTTYAVTAIGMSAFKGTNDGGHVTSVTIPSSVKTIEKYAFWLQKNMGNVSIPSSVTTIADYSFCWCSNMTSATIPNSVTTLGKNVFSQCKKLASVTIGTGVPKIDEYCFYGCEKLTTVTIPDNVTSIASNAFELCTTLNKVTIGTGMTSIGSYAFTGCSALRNLICRAKTPPTLTSSAFDASTYSNTRLYVPYLSVSTYKNATSWKSFYAVEEVHDFVSNGVYYCITGTSTVGVTHKDNTYNSYSGSVTIPSSVTYGGKTYSVTSIEHSAFAESSNLTSVTIPNTVTRISYYVFALCTKLTSMTIPNSVRTLGANEFYGCSALKDVTLGSGLTSIGGYAFSNCNSLANLTCNATTPPTLESTTFTDNHYSTVKVTVPNSAVNAYKSANYWKNFTNLEGLPYDFCVDGIYYKKTSSNTVEVTYKELMAANYTGSVNIPTSVTFGGVTYKVTAIGIYAFYLCRSLTSVTIPNTVTSINACAFEKCSGLTSVTIPNSVTTLGLDAFADCTGLTKVEIPNSVTKIEGLAFYDCTGLTSVILGSGLKNINEKAFYGCTALTTVTCLSATPPTMQASNCFGTSTYSNAKLLVPGASLNTYKSADWWRMFNTVEALPFDFCVDGIYYKKTSSNTVEVTYRELLAESYTGSVSIPTSIRVNNVTYKVTAIGEYAFYMCKNLTSVTMPNSVTSINACAFEKCSGLTSVTIPGSVTILAIDAFSSCTGLKAIDIPNSVTTIAGLAFYGCTALKTATLGTGVRSLGDKAFYGCSALTTVNCYAKTPPAMAANTCFSSTTYSNATLNVPRSSLTSYKTADWWRMFVTIVGVSAGSDPNDVNGDGEVNIADINAVISAILAGSHDVVYDANSDGEVNVADVNAVIEAVLNG